MSASSAFKKEGLLDKTNTTLDPLTRTVLKSEHHGRQKLTHIRKVVEKFVHHDFEFSVITRAADLSVLELDISFQNVDEYIEIGGDPREFKNHKAIECKGFGFGYMMTTQVRHGEKECKGYNRDEIKDTWDQILCTTPNLVMSCYGDSGGPMICNDKLYGVYSYSINYA
ncbi:hypothetical protein QTP88_020680 [Uroleucon formosanum]